jgi:hypothetical protein
MHFYETDKRRNRAIQTEYSVFGVQCPLIIPGTPSIRIYSVVITPSNPLRFVRTDCRSQFR